MKSHSNGGIRTISIESLKELLIKSHDDVYVAEQAGCTIEVVQMIRRMTNLRPSSKIPKASNQIVPKLKHKPQKENPSKNVIILQEMKHKAEMELGSKNLLIRMLETGQHCLKRDDFIKVCHLVGVSHRIPQHLLI